LPRADFVPDHACLFALVDLLSILAIDAVVQDARFVVRWKSELRFDSMRTYDSREHGYSDQSDNEMPRKIHDLTPSGLCQEFTGCDCS
jgi:hypothetical protein